MLKRLRERPLAQRLGRMGLVGVLAVTALVVAPAAPALAACTAKASTTISKQAYIRAQGTASVTGCTGSFKVTLKVFRNGSFWKEAEYHATAPKTIYPLKEYSCATGFYSSQLVLGYGNGYVTTVNSGGINITRC